MICEGGIPKLSETRIQELLPQVPGWEVIDDHHILKKFSFPDFVSALEWVNKLGELAEQEFHHPDIYLTWGKVEVKIWTHAVGGLTENDFILAAKTDNL